MLPAETGEDPTEQHMDHTTVGLAQHTTATRLCGRWLLIARVAWLGVTALTLGLVILGFIASFDRPELLGTPGVEALVARLGLPMQTVMAAALLVPMAAVATIAISSSGVGPTTGWCCSFPSGS
jgi:hypothetical protein